MFVHGQDQPTGQWSRDHSPGNQLGRGLKFTTLIEHSHRAEIALITLRERSTLINHPGIPVLPAVRLNNHFHSFKIFLFTNELVLYIVKPLGKHTWQNLCIGKPEKMSFKIPLYPSPIKGMPYPLEAWHLLSLLFLEDIFCVIILLLSISKRKTKTPIKISHGKWLTF